MTTGKLIPVFARTRKIQVILSGILGAERPKPLLLRADGSGLPCALSARDEGEDTRFGSRSKGRGGLCHPAQDAEREVRSARITRLLANGLCQSRESAEQNKTRSHRLATVATARMYLRIA
ncbi:MAG: hypothetical protein DWI22_12155 [Planctomycetota bacterium]|nr:MAG: hypothetical protein DWI22_12155 [Planctomycetota bacterium]